MAATYDIHDFPFIDRQGSTRILEMGVDITERKRAEELLREQEELLELAPFNPGRDLENRIVYGAGGVAPRSYTEITCSICDGSAVTFHKNLAVNARDAMPPGDNWCGKLPTSGSKIRGRMSAAMPQPVYSP